MPIKEHMSVDWGRHVLFRFSRPLPEGSIFRNPNHDGFHMNGGSVVRQFTVRNDGLEGESIPLDELIEHRLTGGATEIHPVTVRYERKDINRLGSQIYARTTLGPVTIWRRPVHVLPDHAPEAVSVARTTSPSSAPQE